MNRAIQYIVSVATNDANVPGKIGTEVTAIKITLGGENYDSGSIIREKVQSEIGRASCRERV